MEIHRNCFSKILCFKSTKLLFIIILTLLSNILKAEIYYNSHGFEIDFEGPFIEKPINKYTVASENVKYVTENPYKGEKCIGIFSNANYSYIRFLPNVNLNEDKVYYYDLYIKVPDISYMKSNIWSWDGAQIVIKYTRQPSFEGRTFLLLTFHESGNIYLTCGTNQFKLKKYESEKYMRITIGVNPIRPKKISVWINNELLIDKFEYKNEPSDLPDIIGGLEVHWVNPKKTDGIIYVDDVIITDENPFEMKRENDFKKVKTTIFEKETFEKLFLVRNKNPVCAIAISENTQNNYATMLAIKDFIYHIKKISNADIPIIKEDEIKEDKFETYIFVGDTKITKKFTGYTTSNLFPEEFIIITKQNKIFILGDDRPVEEFQKYGTFFAFSYILQNYLGVKWFMPGELGEYIPKKDNVFLPIINIKKKPSFLIREMWNSLGNVKKINESLESLGLKPESEKINSIIQETNLWFIRNGTGRGFKGEMGHGFEKWYDKYFEDHPEWFALQLNNSRIPISPKLAHLCISNPGVWEQWNRNAVEYFLKKPLSIGFEAAPNDQIFSGHCLCNNCKKLDVESEYKIDLKYGDKKLKSYPLSDRYVWFYNKLAEILEKNFPDKYVFGNAYESYLSPPAKEKLKGNVVILFVGPSILSEQARLKHREWYKKWIEMGCKNIILRPNIFHSFFALPLNYAKKIAEDIKYYSSFKETWGFIFDQTFNHWGSHGLNYYIITKSITNPEINVEEEINTYINLMYQDVSNLMKVYYDELEKFTDLIMKSEKDFRLRSGFAKNITEFYTPEKIKKFKNLLEVAKDKTEFELVKKRIELVEQAWDYADLLINLIRETKEKDNPKTYWTTVGVEKLKEFRQKSAFSYGINGISLFIPNIFSRYDEDTETEFENWGKYFYDH